MNVSRPSRHAGLRAGVIAIVAGLVLTSVAYAFVANDTRRLANQAVAQPANAALLSVDHLLTGVDEVLSTAAGVAATVQNDPQRFADALAPNVSEGSTIGALALVTGSTGTTVTVGTPRLLTRARSAALAAGTTPTLIASHAEKSVYIAGFAEQLTHGLGSVYVEIAVPVPSQPATSFALVRKGSNAISFGTVAKLDGLTRAPQAVVVGGAEFSLYVRKNADPDRFAGMSLSTLTLLFGLALTTLAAACAVVAARRRAAVASLSSENRALDAALERQRIVEADLRAWQARFRAMLRDSPDIVVLLDLCGGSCEVLNRPDLLGHPLEEVATTDALLALVLADDRNDADAHWARMRELEAEQVCEATLRLVDADGSIRFTRLRCSPLNAGDGRERVVLGQISDVTDQWSNQIREAELQEALRRSQRFDAVGQLAGGIAHDFNNVLAAVLASAELLEDDIPPAAREYTTEIQRAAQRGAALVRQLLTFAQRDAAEPEIVDVNEVVQGLEPLLRRTIGEHVHLQVTTTESPFLVRADPTHLEQVVLNLAVNGRDAMPEGGILWIATAIDVDGSDHAQPRGVLSVTDTGTGIAPDVRDRMFEPFVTTKDPGQGTGLGLATVMSIVQELHGDITVMSERDQGTTFEVALSLTSGTVPERPVAGGRPFVDGSGRTILVVEDDGSVRSALARTLERRNFSVLTATNGNDALRTIEREHVDVVLTDVVMPGMSGIALTEILRVSHSHLRVILMSGYSRELLDGEPLDGVVRLRKPFTTAELFETLAQIFDNFVSEGSA